MISFRKDNYWFNYRAAAIITRPCAAGGIEVLATTEAHLKFCYLPGGRVEMGEEAQTAVVREIREELGVLARVDRLIVVAETFHPHGDGSQGHNVELYFAASLPDAPAIYEASEPLPGCDSELDLMFFWQRPNTEGPGERSLVPFFLRGLLSQPLPPHPIHIVHRED